MKRIIFLLLLCCVALPLTAQDAVEITAEPSHHQVLANDYVRVFKVEVAPHATTLVHWHRKDYMWVGIGASEVTNIVTGKAPAKLKIQDGEVHFTEGNFSHKATDDSNTPFRNVTIEVLKPGKAAANAESRGLELASGLAIDTVFVKDGVRVRDITMNPGVTLPQHTHHAPHLVVAVSTVDIKSVSARGERELHQKPGDIEWVPAGATHSLVNLGKAPARFITFEFE